MVQQTIDSTFSEYGLANSETAFSKHDKHLPVPLVAKKTALRDLQKENTNMVPKSDESSLVKENEPATEAVKVSGTKRPEPESMIRSSHQQTPTSNGHLVYVRRKQESEHKNSNCNKTTDQSKDEKIHEQSPTNHSTACTPKDVPETKTSSEGVSSAAAAATPLVPLDSGKSNITSPVADSNCLQSEYPKRSNLQQWEERFCRLQNFLKVLDQSNQDDYRHMLRSLSSVDLSRLAVELEKRSIQLSFEEAKEVQRARLLDVLDEHPRNTGEHQLKK